MSLQLSLFVLSEKNPLGSSRLAKLKHIFESGENVQLIFPAEDLGFRYLKGALVSDNISSAIEPPTGRRREYTPCTDPGSRLPHMNVRHMSSSLANEDIISTLDLVSVENVEFLLIIAPVKESYHLAQAAFKVAEGIKVPLKVCVLCPEKTSTGKPLTSVEALMPWRNLLDVEEVKGSPTSPSWWNLCKMTDKGALLVRPNEHVAWRARTANINDPISEMRQVFSKILGLDATSA